MRLLEEVRNNGCQQLSSGKGRSIDWWENRWQMTEEMQISRWNGSIEWLCASHQCCYQPLRRQQKVVLSKARSIHQRQQCVGRGTRQCHSPWSRGMGHFHATLTSTAGGQWVALTHFTQNKSWPYKISMIHIHFIFHSMHWCDCSHDRIALFILTFGFLLHPLHSAHHWSKTMKDIFVNCILNTY